MARPDVVFADEPTGSLDSLAGEQVMELPREVIVRDGRATTPALTTSAGRR